MSQWPACDLRFLAKRLRTPRIEDSQTSGVRNFLIKVLFTLTSLPHLHHSIKLLETPAKTSRVVFPTPSRQNRVEKPELLELPSIAVVHPYAIWLVTTNSSFSSIDWQIRSEVGEHSFLVPFTDSSSNLASHCLPERLKPAGMEW
jgi:hypothetical protein